MFDFSSGSTPTSCRNCDKPIVLHNDKWVHVVGETSVHGFGIREMYVSCRAASYVEGVGWDENIPKSKKARPLK